MQNREVVFFVQSCRSRNEVVRFSNCWRSQRLLRSLKKSVTIPLLSGKRPEGLRKLGRWRPYSIRVSSLVRAKWFVDSANDHAEIASPNTGAQPPRECGIGVSGALIQRNRELGKAA